MRARATVDHILNDGRGAIVKAMAICTRYPFVQIFKPVLLLALDDYFMNPSQDCLARLFDAVNAMDLSNMPALTRYEKLIMRTTERQDVVIGRYADYSPFGDPGTATQQTTNFSAARPSHRASNSGDSRASFEEGAQRPRRDTQSTRNGADSIKSATQVRSPASPSEASFSLDGSAVWVGDESGLDQMGFVATAASASSSSIGSGAPTRGRRSTDASSSSSHGAYARGGENATSLTGAATAALKDAHFYHTAIHYNEHLLPVKVPLSTFPEEVGEVRTNHSVISKLRNVIDPCLRVPLPRSARRSPLLSPLCQVLHTRISTQMAPSHPL